MAVDVKLLHIFLITTSTTLRRRKCTGFSKFFSYSEYSSSADPSCLKSMLKDFKCFKDFSVDIIDPN